MYESVRNQALERDVVIRCLECIREIILTSESVLLRCRRALLLTALVAVIAAKAGVRVGASAVVVSRAKELHAVRDDVSGVYRLTVLVSVTSRLNPSAYRCLTALLQVSVYGLGLLSEYGDSNEVSLTLLAGGHRSVDCQREMRYGSLSVRCVAKLRIPC